MLLILTSFRRGDGTNFNILKNKCDTNCVNFNFEIRLEIKKKLINIRNHQLL